MSSRKVKLLFLFLFEYKPSWHDIRRCVLFLFFWCKRQLTVAEQLPATAKLPDIDSLFPGRRCALCSEDQPKIISRTQRAELENWYQVSSKPTKMAAGSDVAAERKKPASLQPGDVIWCKTRLGEEYEGEVMGFDDNTQAVVISILFSKFKNHRCFSSGTPSQKSEIFHF